LQQRTKKNIKAYFVHASAVKDLFATAKAALPISVGQKCHEEEKFAATLKIINKNFKSCSIIICDTLQRHTLSLRERINENKDVLYKKALKMGDRWLQRNRPLIEQLTIPHEILRWDKWLNDPNYQLIREKIDLLYQSDKYFKQKIIDTIDLFVERYTNKCDNIVDEKIIFASCLEYVKEECTVELLWVNERFNFEIYPSERIPAMEAVYQKFIKPKYPNLQQWVRINFKTKKTACNNTQKEV
jgi:tRNA-dependent cyclodipeptide synthase